MDVTIHYSKDSKGKKFSACGFSINYGYIWYVESTYWTLEQVVKNVRRKSDYSKVQKTNFVTSEKALVTCKACLELMSLDAEDSSFLALLYTRTPDW